MMETKYSLKGKRVWVAGHTGMVGAALVRRLQNEACKIVTAPRRVVDLRDRRATLEWVKAVKPDAVFCAAARVGGIHANDTAPVDFLRDNLDIQLSVIEAAHQTGAEKLLFLGSSCIYPREARQPISEDALMTGPLEPTNQWYAAAKIAGIMQCQAYRRQHGERFISAMPTNLYGPGDNYHPMKSHVVAALIRKIQEAHDEGREVVDIWGSGRPRREFLFVDDCADALVFLMKHYDHGAPINVGTGSDISITELAERIASTVGFKGYFAYDPDKPDGMPRKRLDVSRLSARGWRARTSLDEGLAMALSDFKARQRNLPERASA